MHRKLLQPTFAQKNLQTFVSTFQKNSLLLTLTVEKHIDCSEFDLFPYISRASFGNICGIDFINNFIFYYYCLVFTFYSILLFYFFHLFIHILYYILFSCFIILIYKSSFKNDFSRQKAP